VQSFESVFRCRAQRQCALRWRAIGGACSATNCAAAARLVAVAGAGIGECAAGEARAEFYELDGSGGVKALDVRQGTGASPRDGDRVEVKGPFRRTSSAGSGSTPPSSTRRGWRTARATRSALSSSTLSCSRFESRNLHEIVQLGFL
jgi:hypothetical protein